MVIDLEDGERVVSIFLNGIVGMETELAKFVKQCSKIEDTKINLIFNQIYGCQN